MTAGRVSERLSGGLPLLLCGAFLAYLAAADGTVFDAVLGAAGGSRPAVAAATVLAAAPPMFFATGMVKMSALRGWDTIHQYEMLLRRRPFYVAALLLLAAVAALAAAGGVHLHNVHVVAGCAACAAYLAGHAARM